MDIDKMITEMIKEKELMAKKYSKCISLEELEKLEKHCRKTIKFDRDNWEHRLVLYLIDEYKNSIPKEKIIEKIKEIEERIEEENEMLELNQICKEDYESRFKYLNYALNIYKRLLGDE